MITVQTTLETIANAAFEAGWIIVQLHGYGQQIPRVPGVGMLSRVAQAITPDKTTGVASVGLYGNDVITPAGTYYTFKVLDSNGDLSQINAYIFGGPAQTVDLSALTPIDPDILTPPAPPTPVTSQIVIVPFAPAQIFDGTAGLTFDVLLTGNHTSASLPNAVPGNLYTFIYTQDATGGRLGMWPSQSRGGGQVDPTPNATTVQVFVARQNGTLDAASVVMWDGAA